MQMIRAINVITLACLLLLTGCFGLVDDELTTPAEGTGTGVEVINNAPSLTSSETLNMLFAESEEYEAYYDANDQLEGFTFSLYNAAIDIDGDNMTVGWDTNIDGIIDVNTTANSGVTEFSIPITEMNELDGFDYEGYYHSIFALIAIDEHGLGNSAFVETYHFDYDSYDGNTDGNLALYQFGAEDANGDTTIGTEDNLVRVTMSQGGDLNWASISVKISVNNGAPVTCDNPGATGGSCGLVEFGSTSDQVWSVGDGVTIVESGQDLCTAGETCEVKVTITDTREGKTLDESTSFAE